MLSYRHNHWHVPSRLACGTLKTHNSVYFHCACLTQWLDIADASRLDTADASFYPNLQSQCTPHSSAEGRFTAILMGPGRLLLCHTS